MNINQDFKSISCSVCEQNFKSFEELQIHSCASYLKNMITGLDKRLKEMERFASKDRPYD